MHTTLALLNEATANLPHIVAAATPGVLDDSSGIGKILAAVLKSVAILLVLAGLFKAVKSILEGKMGPAVRVLVGAAVLAAILWSPSILTGALDALKTVLENIFSGLGKFFGT